MKSTKIYAFLGLHQTFKLKKKSIFSNEKFEKIRKIKIYKFLKSTWYKKYEN